MILAFVAAAFAQNSNFAAEGRDCALPAAIYGTSGWANAQQAVDTNATTYSAATFAEKLGLEKPRDREEGADKRGVVVWEVNETFNVARVPSFHGEFGQNYSRGNDCDKKYTVGLRPVDLQATLLAGSFGYQHFGGFFAASQTSGQVAEVDGLMRLTYLGYLYPLYGTLSLPFAPFLAGEYQSGSGGIGLDAVYGLWVDTQWVAAKAGYTKSSGLYANARDKTLGLFATAVIQPDGGFVPVLRAGMQRFDPGALNSDARNAGMPTLYYRDIPLAAPVGVNQADVERERLRTTHFRLDDIMRIVDVAAAARLRPAPGLAEGLIGVHTPSYNTREGDEPDHIVPYVLAKAGVVTLLEQPSLGVTGGTAFSTRAEVGFKGPKTTFWFHLQYNDAEQLALYPFARNALSLQYHLEVGRW